MDHKYVSGTGGQLTARPVPPGPTLDRHPLLVLLPFGGIHSGVVGGSAGAMSANWTQEDTDDESLR
jgi:hypothetical protein